MLSQVRKLAWIFLTGLCVTAAAAQADCPTIVQSALEATDTACQATGRNQVCYGNILLSAVARDGSSEVSFEAPGDIVDVAGIQSLALEPLDVSGDTWGIAWMQLQANLPDSLPGQNLTVLLFGDVEIASGDSTPAPVTFEVVSSGTINVRGGPSTGDERIAGLNAGQSVTTDGRNEDGSWLHIALEDGTTGWVSAELVTAADDITLLSVIDPLAAPAPVASTMQAFYFKTGIGDAPCSEAPDSGILIQTPEGVGQITLTVNEVEIELGSTLYLQTLNTDEIAINVVEHEATVSAQGVSRFVPAGTRVRVPVDPNLAASGPPSEPEPYDNADLAALPVGHLPRPVPVAAALTPDELAALSTAAQPASGEWFYESPTAALSGGCDPTVPADPPPARAFTMTVTDEFTAEAFLRGLSPNFAFPEDAAYVSPAPGVYTADYTMDDGSTFHLEMQFVAPDRAEGVTSLSWDDTGGRCIFDTTFVITAQ